MGGAILAMGGGPSHAALTLAGGTDAGFQEEIGTPLFHGLMQLSPINKC